MKQEFILIDKSEVNNLTGFFDRKEMYQYQADNKNKDLEEAGCTLIWILQPNF